MVALSGVKKSGSGAFYYDENDINMKTVPVSQCQGNYILTPQELQKYFGVDSARMGPLPEYLIVPHLNSTWNTERSSSSARSWWDITGEIVAYRPIEWVPIVRELRTFPYNHFEVEFNKTTTTIETSKIYGHAEASFTISTGSSWKGIKCELSSTTSIKASYETSTEVRQEITEKGRIGGIVIKEIVMGMSLRVQRVFERGVKLYLNDQGRSDSLTWEGPESWNDIHVKADSLRDVGALQFHPITMTGTGHSDSLWLQVLPVFDTDRKLTDMHLVLSCKGWKDWYAYTQGTGSPNGSRVETIPLPDNKKPLVTFIDVPDVPYVPSERG